MSRRIWPILLCVFALGCTRETPPDNSLAGYFDNTGREDVLVGGVRMIPIETPKGSFKVWTKRIGNNPTIKVLLLHGGPGATHEYLKAFDSYLPGAGIEYYYDDQLGSAYSDQPEIPELWDLPRFVDEGLIVSNMMASIPAYNAYAKSVLMPEMDQAALAEIQALERAEDYENPRYMELLVPMHYEKHILRMPADQWPDPVQRAFEALNYDLYLRMQGPIELGASGKIEHWDRTADLKTIKAPTLVIGARYDTMDPKHMEWMAGQFPNGSYLYCPEGSHFAFYDDQATYFKELIEFLRKVDS